MCTLRDIVFAEAEPIPLDLVPGDPHHVAFMPISLLLQVEDVPWVLPEYYLPSGLPAGVDRRGLFQLRPRTDYLRAGHGTEYFC